MIYQVGRHIFPIAICTCRAVQTIRIYSGVGILVVWQYYTDKTTMSLNSVKCVGEWRTYETRECLLGRTVRAYNVLNLISVWILKAEAAHTKPNPVTILGTEAIHYGHCLTLQLQNCITNNKQ